MAKAKAPFWPDTETVLLDMDGTLLDLAFDNRFWLERVPAHYARAKGLSFDTALSDLRRQMQAVDGQLQWYCLDYWSQRLGFDLEAMKLEHRREIRMLPGIRDFLTELTTSGRQVAIATNAHPAVLALKLEETGLDQLVGRQYTAHDFGAAKESPRFWQALESEMGFDPATTLFADDSLAVLASARRHGIAHLCAVARPASNQPPRTISDFPAVEALPELGPVPPKL
ncbi:putative hydrolase of the HAD superfamily [Natronospira proteinivora]|uniref:Hydrolase of the HAD superfamily n=1 Tax=Natronospira proteinivora TaxID=1807133 RepID=A0ABT1GBA6_9GAMM|nr:GMP/IMP nucleotidase [Natronospira proteinivora]MCP1728595.1 putative hydrolase of the HAD superfamily [Natronospira proteinivora]